MAHVQLGYDTVTRAVGIRPEPEGARGRYKLRRQPNRSALLDVRRFFAHHVLSVGEPRTFDAEAFGQVIVGFRFTEPGEAEGEAPAAEAKPGRDGKRKGTAA
ncbi:MAG TPA: hypothetical protein VF017_06490 [Thermoanaerobaculia bacterium]|nr:hypothetical protein [Thermoanaerobaculia bacterium]